MCIANDLICNLLALGLDLRDEKDVGLYCILGGIEAVRGLEGGCADIATSYGAIEASCGGDWGCSRAAIDGISGARMVMSD